MPVLSVSFEIEYDNESDYNAIYKALQSAIVRGVGNAFWSETTSFFIVNAQENAVNFTHRVVAEAKMRKGKDRIVVLDAAFKAGATWGKITDQAIYDLVPFIQKL